MSKFSQFIDAAGDKLGTSGFAKEKNFIEKSLYCELTRNQYNSYKDELKIHKRYGGRVYTQKYAAYGVPMEQSGSEFMNDILTDLAKKKVIFEKGISTTHGQFPVEDMLQFKLEDYARAVTMQCYHWSNRLFCEPYMSRLDACKENLRQNISADRHKHWNLTV